MAQGSTMAALASTSLHRVSSAPSLSVYINYPLSRLQHLSALRWNPLRLALPGNVDECAFRKLPRNFHVAASFRLPFSHLNSTQRNFKDQDNVFGAFLSKIAKEPERTTGKSILVDYFEKFIKAAIGAHFLSYFVNIFSPSKVSGKNTTNRKKTDDASPSTSLSIAPSPTQAEETFSPSVQPVKPSATSLPPFQSVFFSNLSSTQRMESIRAEKEETMDLVQGLQERADRIVRKFQYMKLAESAPSKQDSSLSILPSFPDASARSPALFNVGEKSRERAAGFSRASDIQQQLSSLRADLRKATNRALSVEDRILSSVKNFNSPIAQLATSLDSSSRKLKGSHFLQDAFPLSPSPVSSPKSKGVKRISADGVKIGLEKTKYDSSRSLVKSFSSGALFDLEMNMVSEQEMEVYARAICPAFVDKSLRVSEQKEGVQLLVQELLAAGGSEAWVRNYVAAEFSDISTPLTVSSMAVKEKGNSSALSGSLQRKKPKSSTSLLSLF